MESNNVTIPSCWAAFVDMAVAVHDAKDADYEHAYMNMLLDPTTNGRSIWAWEVKKKLDRLRRWINRGQLSVKGESALDSVIDLSNYTLQYDLSSLQKPYEYLTHDAFMGQYMFKGMQYIIKYLVYESYTGIKLLDLNDDVDKRVLDLIRNYMGCKCK